MINAQPDDRLLVPSRHGPSRRHHVLDAFETSGASPPMAEFLRVAIQTPAPRAGRAWNR
jgi:hypothetical protein